MNETYKPKDAIEAVRSGDWIYFTKSSQNYNYGDIYKVRYDGSELTLMYPGLCDNIKIKGRELYFTEYCEDDCYEGYTVEYKEKRCSIPLDETEIM